MKGLYSLLILVCLMSCNNQKALKETLPPTISKSFVGPRQGYSDAVIVTSATHKTIYISGQIGTGASFEEQFTTAINQLNDCLSKSGARFSDVVKYTTYIVDYKPEYLERFRTIRKQLLGDERMPASTLVGVESLGQPEWKVEIEAIAIVPND